MAKAKKSGRASAPPKKPRREQQTIPGTDHDRIPDLDAIAAEHVEITSTISELRVRAGENKKKALELLHKHGREVYVAIDPGTLEKFRFTITQGEEDVKIQPLKDPKEKSSDVEPAEVSVQ